MEDSQNTPETPEVAPVTPEVPTNPKQNAPLAALAYVPVAFIVTAMQKGKDEFYMWHAKMGAAMTIVFIVLILLSQILYMGVVGTLLYVAWAALALIAAGKAWSNEKLEVPGLIQLANAMPLEKFAGTSTTPAPKTASIETSEVEEVAMPEETPSVEEAPAVEEATVEEETPSVEEAPAVEEVPVEEETPSVEEAPTVEEVTLEEETPSVEEAPAVEEVPVVEQTPTIGPEIIQTTPESEETLESSTGIEIKPAEVETSTPEVTTPAEETTPAETPSVPHPDNTSNQ